MEVRTQPSWPFWLTFTVYASLLCGCSTAQQFDLSRATNIEFDQVSHDLHPPKVSDCAIIQAGRFSCNGKVYTSQELAAVREKHSSTAGVASSGEVSTTKGMGRQ
jgi:hypothetical protein